MLRRKEKVHKPGKSEGFSLIVFSLVLVLSCSHSPAQSEVVKPVQDTEVISIGELEEKVLHQKFDFDSKDTRLSRLEDFVFGKKYSEDTTLERIKKLSEALKANQEEKTTPTPGSSPAITPESLNNTQEVLNDEPRIVYDESFNVGILGTVSQLEKKVFNMTFINVSFPTRVAALENRLLTKYEIVKNKKKPLLDRITILMQKVGMPQNRPEPLQFPPPANFYKQPSQNNPTHNSGPQSYTIDPNTGLLINEQTMETVQDSFGNPIKVTLPKPNQNLNPNSNAPYGFPYQQNPLNQNSLPYGNPYQQNQYGGFPTDLLFNQQDLTGGGSDPGY